MPRPTCTWWRIRLSGAIWTVVRASHTLKGMLKNLAVNSAAEIAATIENAGRDKNLQKAAAQIPLLEKALNELGPEIESQLIEVHV
jgi:HPt (histidine-containing phosphotransfer) domain-containing protein